MRWASAGDGTQTISNPAAAAARILKLTLIPLGTGTRAIGDASGSAADSKLAVSALDTEEQRILKTLPYGPTIREGLK